ncbi:hypothetical protein JCM10213_005588 [Rhodosporidiobolus nylandii]
MAPKSRPRSTDSTSTALDDPTEFDSPALRALDHSLRCPICTSLFSAPVLLTGCSHAFDSLCLREYLSDPKTRRCPECMIEANEDKIRPVHALEAVVRGWKAARVDILALQAAASAHASTSRLPPPSSPTPVAGPSRPSSTSSSKPPPFSDRKGKRKASPSPAVKREDPANAVAASEVIELDSSDVEVHSPPPRKKGRLGDEGGRAKTPTSLAKGKGKGKAKEGLGDPTDPNLVVSCPICASAVKNGSLNSHLDSGCKTGKLSAAQAVLASSAVAGGGGAQKTAWGKLMSSGGGRGTPSSESETEAEMDTSVALPLKDYAYKGIKDLSRMLKEYRLPLTFPPSAATNDQKTDALKRRHQHFTTLWNANADVARESPAHKSAKELRAELERWEKEREREERERLKGGRGGTLKEAGEKEWQRIHAEQFRELTAQARASAAAMRQKQQQAANAQTSAAQQASLQQPLDVDPVAALAEDDPRQPTPTLRDLDLNGAVEEDVAIEDAAVAPVSAKENRKRSVRIVTPPPRSSPPPAVSASSSPAQLPLLSPSPSLSPPPFSRDEFAEPKAPSRNAQSEETRAASEVDEMEEEEDEEEGVGWKLPRPSQRNREEERMFAEMDAARAKAGLAEEDEEDETNEGKEDA